MSTDRGIIKNTGRNGNTDLSISSFSGLEGKSMLQLTQGFGGCAGLKQLDRDKPGYIQLSILDAYKVIIELTEWIKDDTQIKAKKLQKQINDNIELQKTIFSDSVKCQHFIDDIKIIEIPVKLLS